jgi:hypothetical protein
MAISDLRKLEVVTSGFGITRRHRRIHFQRATQTQFLWWTIPILTLFPQLTGAQCRGRSRARVQLPRATVTSGLFSNSGISASELLKPAPGASWRSIWPTYGTGPPTAANAGLTLGTSDSICREREHQSGTQLPSVSVLTQTSMVQVRHCLDVMRSCLSKRKCMYDYLSSAPRKRLRTCDDFLG